jgi:hypothetical protein
MRRIPWDILLALLVGLGLGLGYTWFIAPRPITDATPLSLRADFKDQYRSAIAAAYAATGNLPRAGARLALAGDADPVEALNAQAQRMRAGSAGGNFEHADQVAALAFALDDNPNGAPVPTSNAEAAEQTPSERTITPDPVDSPSEEPIILTETLSALETPQVIETQPAETVSIPTPRPTHTATPEPGEPFALTGQETVCDPNLPDGLLQVLALNASRRQLPGVEIVITWDGGREQFFTGLKPELGNGYADYLMTPDTTYTVQLARGSDVALDVTAPTCQSPDGATFSGSIKLTFQQP